MAVIRYINEVLENENFPIHISKVKNSNDVQLLTCRVELAYNVKANAEVPILKWDQAGSILAVISVTSYDANGSQYSPIKGSFEYKKKESTLYYKHTNELEVDGHLLVTFLTGNV